METAGDTVMIPGPLRSFLRMAGISQEIAPADVLPLLSRNIVLRGYGIEGETEFLLLLQRYVRFARDLELLTDASGTIRVGSCDDALPLVRTLGYRFQQACGEKATYLVTAMPERAFLTIDSGFPITELEEALQKHTPFTYEFAATPVPVLFSEKDWTAISSWRLRDRANLIDVILHDPNLARLYWSMSALDGETRVALRRTLGLRTLLPQATALGFYGTEICIRSGRVVLPGAPDSEQGWEELVGASPKSPGEFVQRLLEKDDGWLAAYFDSISRVSHSQQAHLTAGSRLRFLYHVYRAVGAGSESSATRGVFPQNGDLLILFSKLQWEPNGDPYIPANLGIWREILLQKTSSKLVRDWVKRARTWDSPDQLLGTLVALSRFQTESGPLQTYLMLSEIDSVRRPGLRLSDGTVRLLAVRFAEFHDWYLIFSDFPALDDTSITRFLTVAEAISGISSPTLRANALGAFQANIGIWKILASQQEIPAADVNTSWQNAILPFTAASSSVQLFDATRSSLRSILLAATGKGDLSQEELVDLLAGPPQKAQEGQRVHQILAARMQAVLDDQRLVSLDTLFALYDGLDEMAHGSADGDRLLPLAGSLREFEMPRAIFTSSEKVAWAPQIYTSRHAELQVRTDLTQVIRQPGSPAQLEAARAQLTPFLRDTLVGLNYAWYEPPGAQVLHHNPLFVRSHDFAGSSILGYDDIWGAPSLIGVGVTAGGGAYLFGSLADLPYALATTEEDFIAPANVQALIWKDAVPQLLVDAVQPRWWGVSPSEMHAAALYQRAGEELLTAAAANPPMRAEVVSILSDLMTSARLESTEEALQHPEDVRALISQMLPAETFFVTAEFRRRYPAETSVWGPAGRELDDLMRTDPAEVSTERLSRDFGVPHPTLEQRDACMLVGGKPFPALAGTSYRLFGESWQSNNLYWARLADEAGYLPPTLNLLVPELNRQMIANIFATDIEDRPALLRAMEQTGREFLNGRIAAQTAGSPALH
jgi:hypothetical protein